MHRPGKPDQQSDQQRDQAFWERNATKYARSKIANEDAYRYKLRLTQSRLKPDMDLLELGCGTGSTALEHAPYVRRILATDFSDKMLALGAEKAARAGVKNITFQRTSVEDLDMPASSFDAVLALSLLHLLQDRRSALSKIHNLLKPNGLFVSSTMCLGDSALRLVSLIAPLGRRLGTFPNFSVLKADELVAQIEDAGFTVEHRWQSGPRTATFLMARKTA